MSDSGGYEHPQSAERTDSGTFDDDEAQLAVVRAGGDAAAAALVSLGERWLLEGRAQEGAQKLPQELGDLRSDAALDVLERLFDQAEDSARLERVLARRVDVEATPRGKGRALEKLAALYCDVSRDFAAASGALLAAAQAYTAAQEPEDAERAYERLLDISPDHVNAAARLAALRADTGNFAGVAEAFGTVLRAHDDTAFAAELLLSLAAAAQRASAAQEFSELADDVLWRLSGEQHELSARLLRASAELYAAQTHFDEAAELFRRLIADRGAQQDIDAYQALIDSNPAAEWRRNQQRWLFEWQEHHASDRPTVLLRWADFEEHELGDPEGALSVLEKAAELAPDRPEIWESMARLRLAEGDAAGGTRAARELHRLGRDVEPALLELLLEHEPGARWAVDRVKLIFTSGQRWPELFELYDRAIAAATDEGERAAWLDEAAIAARDVAQDRARALGYWEQFAELVIGDARVDLALERLYEQLSLGPQLIRHLKNRLPRSEGEDRLALERRITALSLSSGALEEAWASIERVRADTPAAAEDLLEKLFDRSLQLLEADGSAREPGRAAAQALREHHLAKGNPEAAVRVLHAELGLPPGIVGGDERRALLGELSRICEHELCDPSAAFSAERELFLLTLAESDRRRLEELGKKLNRWSDLCQTYERAARAESNVDARRALLRRAADIAKQRLGDTKHATQLYRALLELEPDHASVVFEQLAGEHGELPEAFDALCELLEHSRRFDELSSVLMRATQTHPSPALFSRLGRLQADELGDGAAAIASHLAADDVRSAGEVFLRKPSVYGADGEPSLELAERLSRVGLPEGALRVLRHQLAFYGERHTDERKRVHLELVHRLEESGAAESAQLELSEVAKHYPTDAEVQRRCAVMAAAHGDWVRAEQHYRALLLVLLGEGGRGSHLRRAAVYGELGAIKLRRDDPTAARELFDSGFEAAMGDTAELESLAETLLRNQCWEATERAAAELLKRSPDLPGTTRALWSIAELRRHGRALSAGLLERANQGAVRVAARVEEVTDPSLRSNLLAACVSLLPLPDAERLLEQYLPQLGSDDALRARLELLRRKLDDGDAPSQTEAFEQLQGVVSHPDAPTAAWQLMARAAEARGDTARASRALAAWLEREPHDTALLERALSLALGAKDADQALDLYDRLSRSGLEPRSEVRVELQELCLCAGKTARAAQLLQAQAEHEQQPLKRAALFVESATLLLDTGDVAGACAAAELSRSLDPGSADAVWILAKAALSRGERVAALEFLTTHAESKERRRGKPLARVLRLAAELFLESDALGEALPLLSEAHHLDKSDMDTALLLGLLAIDLDRLEIATSALRALVAQRESTPRDGAQARSLSVAQGYFQLARIEQHHGKKTNAKRMVLRALEEHPALLPAQRLLNELSLN